MKKIKNTFAALLILAIFMIGSIPALADIATSASAPTMQSDIVLNDHDVAAFKELVAQRALDISYDLNQDNILDSEDVQILKNKIDFFDRYFQRNSQLDSRDFNVFAELVMMDSSSLIGGSEFDLNLDYQIDVLDIQLLIIFMQKYDLNGRVIEYEEEIEYEYEDEPSTSVSASGSGSSVSASSISTSSRPISVRPVQYQGSYCKYNAEYMYLAVDDVEGLFRSGESVSSRTNTFSLKDYRPSYYGTEPATEVVRQNFYYKHPKFDSEQTASVTISKFDSEDKANKVFDTVKAKHQSNVVRSNDFGIGEESYCLEIPYASKKDTSCNIRSGNTIIGVRLFYEDDNLAQRIIERYYKELREICSFKPTPITPTPIIIEPTPIIIEPMSSKYEFAVTSETYPGSKIDSVQEGNLFCADEFGSGWEWLEFHEEGGWGVKGNVKRNPSVSRAWVNINDQNAECFSTGKRYGMTWDVTNSNGATCNSDKGLYGSEYNPQDISGYNVGYDIKCNAYQGDTPCEYERPLLCVYKGNKVTPIPSKLPDLYVKDIKRTNSNWIEVLVGKKGGMDYQGYISVQLTDEKGNTYNAGFNHKYFDTNDGFAKVHFANVADSNAEQFKAYVDSNNNVKESNENNNHLYKKVEVWEYVEDSPIDEEATPIENPDSPPSVLTQDFIALGQTFSLNNKNNIAYFNPRNVGDRKVAIILNNVEEIGVIETTAKEDVRVRLQKEIRKHYFIADDQSPANDVVLLQSVIKNVESELNGNYETKLNSEIKKSDLDYGVTTFIYKGQALIIVGDNSPSENVVLAKRISKYLKDQKNIDAIQKVSSDVTNDDLRTELFQKKITKQFAEFTIVSSENQRASEVDFKVAEGSTKTIYLGSNNPLRSISVRVRDIEKDGRDYKVSLVVTRRLVVQKTEYKVDEADVKALAKYITAGKTKDTWDVNLDGQVNVADVVKLTYWINNLDPMLDKDEALTSDDVGVFKKAVAMDENRILDSELFDINGDDVVDAGDVNRLSRIVVDLDIVRETTEVEIRPSEETLVHSIRESFEDSDEVVSQVVDELVYQEISAEDELVVIEDSIDLNCEGCLEEAKCLSLGTRLIRDENALYCDLDNELKDQKKDGLTCQNNFECENNACLSGTCYNLAKELEEQRGMMEKINSWFKKIFR